MRITLESTTKIVSINGIDARIWEGKTSSGIEVQAFIPRIAASRTEDLSEFERELQEHRAPSEAVAVIPLRLLL